MAKVEVKRERMSPSSADSVKEKSSSEIAAVIAETVTDVSQMDDENEISDTETGDRAEQKPLSHQQTMEHFKDALAEIIVVRKSPSALL